MDLNHLSTGKKMAVFAACAVLLAVLPFLVGGALGNSWVRIIDFALLYVMLALGLNIVVGFAGLLDLGFIAFYAIGAYTYALLSSPHFDIHWLFFLTIPLGAAFASLGGVLLGTPVLKLKGDYLAIVTLGFGEIVRIFMNNLNQPVNITNGPQGINLIDPIHIGGASLGQTIELFGLSFHNVYLYYYLFLAHTLLRPSSGAVSTAMLTAVYRYTHRSRGRHAGWPSWRTQWPAGSMHAYSFCPPFLAPRQPTPPKP